MAVAAAADLRTVAIITARLHALLKSASILKAETSVEPALPVAELVEEVDALHDGLADYYDQSYRYNAFETAARQLFYALISSADIHEPAFVTIWNLLDVLILCGDRGKCAPDLVCFLIEELLDSQTTDSCRTVFDYLETRKERLVHKDFHKKNLIFLRSCNELLRRLSKAEDAIFCGRVFFFLFQTFPLGDKSSVNLRGEFHNENTTIFQSEDVNGDFAAENRMSVDIEAPGESDSNSRSTPQPPSKAGARNASGRSAKKSSEDMLPNNELYPIFWRLQQDFCEPTRLFTTANFVAFKKGIGYTITKFKDTPTVVQATAPSNGRPNSKRKYGEEDISDHLDENSTSHFADNYNPKYLTSPDLFELELSDMALKRHILVQSLILIDFLLSLTEKAKKRLATLETSNKSMLYQFTLGEEDAKWAIATRSTITSYVSSMVEGKLFNRMVETVLARDKNWIRWKIESCPSIVRSPIPVESEIEARRNAQNATRVRKIPDKAVGAISLDFLNDQSGGLETLKDPARYTAPSLQILIEGIKMDELDAEMAMDDTEKAGLENAISNKRWRVVRQIRTTQLGLLHEIEPNKNLDVVLNSSELSGEGDNDPVEGEPKVELADAPIEESKVVENGVESVG